MTLKKDRSPKEDFEKALIVIERVKNIMMKEYRERRAAVERILREKMQKWIGFRLANFLKLTAYYFSIYYSLCKIFQGFVQKPWS